MRDYSSQMVTLIGNEARIVKRYGKRERQSTLPIQTKWASYPLPYNDNKNHIDNIYHF